MLYIPLSGKVSDNWQKQKQKQKTHRSKIQRNLNVLNDYGSGNGFIFGKGRRQSFMG